MINSIFQRDFPVVQGVTLVFAIMVVLVNLLADMSYAALDPRVSFDRERVNSRRPRRRPSPASDRRPRSGRGAARRWYRQPALMAGIVILAVVVGMAVVFAPLITSYNPIAQNLNAVAARAERAPFARHRPAGPRHLHPAALRLRLDLRIAFIAVLFPFVLGTVLGSLAGYFGGWADTVIMRLVDIVVAFPFYVLVIALVFVLGPGERSIYIAITAVGWVSYARIIRGEILVAKRQDYVTAARAGGLSNLRIMRRHLLPNVITQAFIYAMSDIVQDILAIVTLGLPRPRHPAAHRRTSGR